MPQRLWIPLELELQVFGGHPAWGLEIEVRSFWKSRRAAELMASALESTFRSKNNQIITGPHISPYLLNVSTRAPLDSSAEVSGRT